MLKRGSKLTQIDWSHDLATDGAGTLMPHLGPARTTGLYLTYQMQQNPARLEELTAAGLGLARHLMHGETLIEYIVGMSIESTILEECYRHLPNLDPKRRAAFITILDAAAPAPSPAHTIEGERHFVTWIQREFESQGAQGVVKLFAGIGAELGADDRFQITSQEEMAAKISSWLGELNAAYDELKAIFDMKSAPRRQAPIAYEARIEDSTNPFIQLLIPASESIVNYSDRRVLNEMILRRLLQAEQITTPDDLSTALTGLTLTSSEPMEGGIRLMVRGKGLDEDLIIELAPKELKPADDEFSKDIEF